MKQSEFNAHLASISHQMLDATDRILAAIDRPAALRAALRDNIAALVTCPKIACRRTRRCRGDKPACVARGRAALAPLNGDP